jgi:hypothetical protein
MLSNPKLICKCKTRRSGFPRWEPHGNPSGVQSFQNANHFSPLISPAPSPLRSPERSTIISLYGLLPGFEAALELEAPERGVCIPSCPYRQAARIKRLLSEWGDSRGDSILNRQCFLINLVVIYSSGERWRSFNNRRKTSRDRDQSS